MLSVFLAACLAAISILLPVRDGWISYGFSSVHPAIDFAVPIGTRVMAARPGWVMYAGWNPQGYGNLVILADYTGVRTFYGHLDEIWVSVGQWVGRGHYIGTSGDTGWATGPHLHFEVRRGCAFYDPIDKRWTDDVKSNWRYDPTGTVTCSVSDESEQERQNVTEERPSNDKTGNGTGTRGDPKRPG